MPSGVYLLTGELPGGTVRERFSCACGPSGWRYVATRQDPDGQSLGRLDLTVDAGWRIVRLLAEDAGWSLRGGAAGPELLWRRGEQEGRAWAASFTGSSPAFAVTTARLLDLGVGEQRRARLVRLGPGLAPLTVDEGWGRTPDVEEAQRYEVADLDSAQRRVLHLVDDVVVDGTGIVLQELTWPPAH